MKNRLLIIFFFQNIFAQHDIPYDLSNQFGINLSNNQIVWNIDQKFDNLLIDSSSKYFKQKFNSFNFSDLKIDSTYVKSKFRYEFGDYGLDILNVGLKKHSQDSDFQFLGFKKSFFGNYSEFADSDSNPLSLFYKFDYSRKISNHLLIFSTGYFRTGSNFLFDSIEDNSNNKEFSDFISFTLIDKFKKGSWNYLFELNHITKNDNIFFIEQSLNHDIDIERNIFKFDIRNNKYFSIISSIDNKYYFDKKLLQSYTQNVFQLSNFFTFKPLSLLRSFKIKYGFDYTEDEVLPNFYYGMKHIFGNQTFSLLINRENKPTTFLSDNPNNQKFETWDSASINYIINSGFSLEANLKWIEVSDLTAYDVVNNSFASFSDDMLSLKTKLGASFNNYHSLYITYRHNFHDSIISSNRSNIVDINYGFKKSFINEKLGINGKISLIYLSENNSDFSFDYFRNMPSIGNNFINDESYSIDLNLDISIGDVILTVRANNLSHRLPIDGDYSIERHEFFNPINSLVSFGILWEFDD